jgi:hypothetical protein
MIGIAHIIIGGNYHSNQVLLVLRTKCKAQQRHTEPSKSKQFSRGIDYVAASRPTVLKILFLLSPLTDRHFNAWPEERAEVRKE